MKLRTLTLLAAALLVGAVAGYAAAAATYQKTGVVKEAGKDTFTLDLGKEGEWRFYTDANTKGADVVKAGQKITVTYKQVATSIEAKGEAKADAKAKKK
jgi:hypothetical protein